MLLQIVFNQNETNSNEQTNQLQIDIEVYRFRFKLLSAYGTQKKCLSNRSNNVDFAFILISTNDSVWRVGVCVCVFAIV